MLPRLRFLRPVVAVASGALLASHLRRIEPLRFCALRSAFALRASGRTAHPQQPAPGRVEESLRPFCKSKLSSFECSRSTPTARQSHHRPLALVRDRRTTRIEARKEARRYAIRRRVFVAPIPASSARLKRSHSPGKGERGYDQRPRE